jgi:cation:H+ antiporter
MASSRGHPAAAIGNILGSNFANVFLALGMTAIIISISTPKEKFPLDIKILLISTIIFLFILLNKTLIVWWVGILLILSLLIYIIYIIKSDNEKYEEEKPKENLSLFKSILIFIIGLAGVSVGAQLLIEGSIDLAKYFGIREAVIGLGVLAFGTSLPEVATSVIAALKKENNIAIGNIVGSNIFNILGIGGVSLLISSNDSLVSLFDNELITIEDIVPFILSTIMLVIFYRYRFIINRIYGIAFVTFYLSWILYIFIN